MKTLELLIDYAKSKNISRAILDAEKYEKKFLEGFDFGEGASMKAWINPDSGFWEGVFEVTGGKLFFEALDQGIASVLLTTISPPAQMGGEPLVRKNVIDFKDIKSIAKTKEYFSKDPLLKNVIIKNTGGKSLAEMLIVHLRNFRRTYSSYARSFSFLWAPTEFKSSLELAGKMRELEIL